MTTDIINLLFGFSFGFLLMQYFAGDEKSIILVVILSLVLILNLISIVFDHLNKVFHKDGDKLWICRNCGHVYIGKDALDVCPVCNHKQSFMEVKADNYE